MLTGTGSFLILHLRCYVRLGRNAEVGIGHQLITPYEEWCRQFIGFSGVVYQVPSLGQVLISGQAGFAVRGHEEDFT